jgi:hypothetical protein
VKLIAGSGAVFADEQVFPGAGAYHSSERKLHRESSLRFLLMAHVVQELFGTFNTTTATASEATLSSSFQTAFANFIKNPTTSPAENWPQYVPGNATQTLAKIAYVGNVDPDNFVQAVQSDSSVRAFSAYVRGLAKVTIMGCIGWSLCPLGFSFGLQALKRIRSTERATNQVSIFLVKILGRKSEP